MRRMRAALIAAVALVLAGCGEPPVIVGSKEPTQDRILAEMFALLLEDEGVPVERRIGLGDSAENFEALRRGAIHLYPEYTGTALGLIGAPPTRDRAAALATLRAAYGDLGLVFLEPLGFESNYIFVTRRALATAQDLERVSDLRRLARRLVLGVTSTFAERPADGLDATLDRYGLVFEDVVVSPGSERAPLYDALIAGELDVMVGFATDPEVADFDLARLEVDLAIFPAYEAVPLATAAVVEAEPRLAAALAPLVGRLDPVRVRRATRQVQIGGRSPRGAAAATLAELDLLERAIAEPELPLRIAASPPDIGSRAAIRVLRAVREAMPGRNVAYLESSLPLEEIPPRHARLAVEPAIAHFDVTEDGVVRDERFETVAAVGSSLIHAVARNDGPDRLSDASVIATGPEGSASHKLVSVLARHRSPPPELAPQADNAVATALAAVRDGVADAAVILAARDRPDVAPVRRDGTDELRLIDAIDWWEGPARLQLPFLRTATLARPEGAESDAPVRTVAMQTTLVGPSAPAVSVLGRQGPGAISTELHPLTDATVLAINQALGPHPDVGPHLRRAAALTPEIRPAPTATNPRPGDAALMIVIFGFLAFAGWLLVRPRPADD